MIWEFFLTLVQSTALHPLCGIFRSILPRLVRLREATDFLSLFGQRCKSLPCLFLLSHELAKVCSLLFLAHVSPRSRRGLHGIKRKKGERFHARTPSPRGDVEYS